MAGDDPHDIPRLVTIPVGADSFHIQRWSRTASGKVILRLIEEWDAGVTEHGDIAMSFTSTIGNDPDIPAGRHRSQFICTHEDARAIAHMILRTLAFSEAGRGSGFAAFRSRIQSPALRALADDWDKARGARRMPAWADINPPATAPYLTNMWGFDYDRANGTFTGRFSGSNVMLALGKSLLGTSIGELYSGAALETVVEHLTRVASEPACAYYTGRIGWIGGQPVHGERLVLPLGADPRHPDGVVGASHTENPDMLHAPQKIEPISDIADWCSV